MKGKNKNVLKRIEIIQQIVNEKYEEGNQSKSKRQVWRHHINRMYPMSERTFYNYMGTDVKKEMKKAEHGQMKIEFTA